MASLLLRLGEHHNDMVTQTYTWANIFLSHLQKPGNAYRGDGRLDSRDLVPLSAGSGIKWDVCFLPPFLRACHSVSSSKCHAFSLFSIKELRDAAWIQQESLDKERQTLTVTHCSSEAGYKAIFCCCQDKCLRLGAAHIHKSCPSSYPQKRMPSLSHGHLSFLYDWNDDIWAEPWNEMETWSYSTQYEHVQLPQCYFIACAFMGNHFRHATIT